MKTVVLIACSGSKVDTTSGPVPARRLYTGQLFTWSVQLAEKLGFDFVILSAEYGVVDPDATVFAYEHKLDKREAIGWGQNVAAQLVARFGEEGVRYIVLAPALYTCFMASMRNVSCVLPLAGMGIGSQRGWILRALRGEVAV